MKQRTKSYLGTFVNSPEGLSSYRLMINHIRQVVTGGRFVKMFRGNSRTDWECNSFTGYIYQYRNGCSRKAGATHFDVYLLPRFNSNTGAYQAPRFYNFILK